MRPLFILRTKICYISIILGDLDCTQEPSPEDGFYLIQNVLALPCFDYHFGIQRTCDINNFVHIWRKFIIYVCRTGGCWRFPTFQIMCSLHRTWQSWSASNLCWSCCSRYEAWDEVSVVSPSKLRVQRAKFFYLYLYRMILCLLYYLRKSNCRRLIISFSALSTWIWASVHNGCLKISLYWLHIFCLFLYNMKQVSNTFYFTFTVRPEAKATKNGFRLRNVVPATEEEARRVLERMDAEALQRSQSI